MPESFVRSFEYVNLRFELAASLSFFLFLSSPFSTTIDSRASVDRITRVKEAGRGGKQGRRKEEIERGNGGVHAFREIHRDFPDASSKGATPPILPIPRPFLLFSHGHARNGFRVYYSWWWCKVALASMSIESLMEIGTIAIGGKISPTIERAAHSTSRRSREERRRGGFWGRNFRKEFES